MLAFIYKKITGTVIDTGIPNIVIFSFFVEKFFSMLRGFIKTGKCRVFIGKNTKLCFKRKIIYGKWLNIKHDVYINALSSKGICFGNNVSIGEYTRIECTGSLSFLGKGFKCGDGCGLGYNSFYGAAGGIELGSNVIVGNYVTMHSENHNFNDLLVPIKNQGVNHKGITIGNDCWIGAKVTILDGTIIGNGCVIAAGAVVTGVFPSNVIIGGVPAKIIKYRGGTK